MLTKPPPSPSFNILAVMVVIASPCPSSLVPGIAVTLQYKVGQLPAETLPRLGIMSVNTTSEVEEGRREMICSS